MSSVNARPFNFELQWSSSMLVCIDMQRDFLQPGGFGESLGNDVSRVSAIVPACRRVLDAWRSRQGHILHTREAHQPDLSDCPAAKRNRGQPRLRIGDPGPMGRILVAGELGTEIVPELVPEAGEWVVDKPGKGMFWNTHLHERLQVAQVRQLIIMGVTTEVCVQTSMREANDRGYDCLLLEDCTESYFPEFKRGAIEMIRAQGAIVGWTATSEQLIQSL